MANQPTKLPKPEVEGPGFETRDRVNINLLGGKRYRLEVATRAYPLNDQPADVIEIPKREGREAD